MTKTFKVEIEQETDGRYIADVPEVPGVMVYGATPAEAVDRVRDLLIRVLRERDDDDGEPFLVPSN